MYSGVQKFWQSTSQSQSPSRTGRLCSSLAGLIWINQETNDYDRKGSHKMMRSQTASHKITFLQLLFVVTTNYYTSSFLVCMLQNIHIIFVLRPAHKLFVFRTSYFDCKPSCRQVYCFFISSRACQILTLCPLFANSHSCLVSTDWVEDSKDDEWPFLVLSVPSPSQGEKLQTKASQCCSTFERTEMQSRYSG